MLPMLRPRGDSYLNCAIRMCRQCAHPPTIMREMADLPGCRSMQGRMQSKPAVVVDVVEALSKGRVGLEGIRDWWQEGFRRTVQMRSRCLSRSVFSNVEEQTLGFF